MGAQPEYDSRAVRLDLSAAGLLIGVLVGLTGMGGGSLMTPMLVLIFGFNPTVAIGTDIVHGAVFKSFGAWRHRRLGTVQGRLSGWMLLGSAPMSLVGVSVATWLKHRYGDGVDSATGAVLGGALLLGGAGLMAKSFLRDRVFDGPFLLGRRDRVAAVIIGLVGGFVVGLTSVGSGVFFGLTMLIVFPLGAAKVVGTDIFHAAALLWVAGAGHIVAGNVDLSTVGWLLIGSIPGVVLGSQLTVRIPERTLRVAMGATLALSGLKLANLPGSAVVVPLGVAAVLAVAALAWRQSFVRRRAPKPRAVVTLGERSR
jgi:uncharacterized membrane protein YfcA